MSLASYITGSSGALIPWRVKQALRPVALRLGLLAFRCGIRTRYVLDWLAFGWGNEGWRADTCYLRALCHWASTVRGSILECGSGLSTILLGVLAPGRTITLEHLPEWKHAVEQMAAANSIRVDVRAAQLVQYDGFQWYELPGCLPKAFDLVICDGPPSITLGGRYGLLPVAGSHFSQDTVILMDDVDRADEQVILRRWECEFSAFCDHFEGRQGSYGEVRLGQNPVETTH